VREDGKIEQRRVHPRPKLTMGTPLKILLTSDHQLKP